MGLYGLDGGNGTLPQTMNTFAAIILAIPKSAIRLASAAMPL
jgi:hypothetical protein